MYILAVRSLASYAAPAMNPEFLAELSRVLKSHDSSESIDKKGEGMTTEFTIGGASLVVPSDGSDSDELSILLGAMPKFSSYFGVMDLCRMMTETHSCTACSFPFSRNFYTCQIHVSNSLRCTSETLVIK